MEQYDIIVAGGCSAGLAAAINASRFHPGVRIAVIEKLQRTGKKILATGNGRCNLSNANAVEHPYHNADFAAYALAKYNVEKTLAFFRSLGLLTYTDSEGRIYPASNTAAGVLDALRFAVQSADVDVICGEIINEISPADSGFIINGKYRCNNLIAALGGSASPSQGADGSGFALMRSLGHTITPLSPSLSPLNADTSVTKQLKGIRVRAVELTAVCNGKKAAKSRGEILFTDTGLSGIAAMELASSFANRVKQNSFTIIDFVPDMSHDELCKYLNEVKNIKALLTVGNLLTGILPKPVGMVICKAAGLYKSDILIDNLSNKELTRVVNAVKGFSLPICGVKGFDSAQVTRGGVDVSEINLRTMESKLHKGLYLAGELIDVDGGCGGYNLQWAWSSGLLAGEMKGNGK